MRWVSDGRCCPQSGHELTACLILMEVSNPCLHSRAIFRVRHTHLAPGSSVISGHVAPHKKKRCHLMGQHGTGTGMASQLHR